MSPGRTTIVFHMDEYMGVGPDHPAGFQRWIRERIAEPARPEGGLLPRRAGCPPAAACARYRASEPDPLDLCCLGIGENGHLAFNDPGVADFDDPRHVVEMMDRVVHQVAAERVDGQPGAVATPARSLPLRHLDPLEGLGQLERGIAEFRGHARRVLPVVVVL